MVNIHNPAFLKQAVVKVKKNDKLKTPNNQLKISS
jgi:hypothetical protein